MYLGFRGSESRAGDGFCFGAPLGKSVVMQQTAPRLIVHIGLEKTGTTSLQRFLAQNEALLAERGAFYPKRNLAYSRGGRNHQRLVGAYFPQDYARYSQIETSRRPGSRVIASLCEEIDRRRGTAILSAEHFSSRFGPDQIDAFAKDFGRYSPRIVIALRDHAERLCSAYSTTVAAGRTLTLDEFIDEVIHPQSRYIRYAETIQLWERVFGASSICLIEPRRGSNAIEDFMIACFGCGAASALSFRYDDHRSLSAPSIEEMRAFNADLSKRATLNVLPEKIRAQWVKLLRGFRLRELRARRGPKLTLTASQIEKLRETIDRDRSWLETRRGLILGAPAPLIEGHSNCGESVFAPIRPDKP